MTNQLPRALFPSALTVAFALLAAPSAGQPTVTPEPASDPTTATVVLRVPGMDQVRVRKNVVFEKVEGTELAADVYLPPPSPKLGKPPVVVLQAGGAENTKDWGVYISLSRLLAASGLAAVPFNHRLRYPRRQYAEGAEDLRALLDLLRRDGDSLGLDGSRLAVAVFSGGGPMLAPLLRQRPASVRCLAAFYAFLDTEHVNLEEAGVSRELALQFSPLAALETGSADRTPLFIARAGKDAIPGINASIDQYVAVALRRNAPVALVNHPDGVHGFDHRNDDPRTREILRMAIAYFQEHLGVPSAP
jgi:dienelactone hydrolase